MSYSYLPYQTQAAEEMLPILQLHKIVYLSMKQRIGKTSTSVYLATLYGAKNVCYLTLKGGPKSLIINDAKKQFKDMSPPFNYEITTHGKAGKLNQDFDLFIIDEADKLGGYPLTPKVVLTMKKLCKQKPIIYLSATPFGDMSLSSLFNQFAISTFSPWRGYKTFGNDKTGFYAWAREYVDRIEDENGRMQFHKIRVSKDVQKNDFSRCSKNKHFPKIKKYFKFLTHEEAGFEVAQVTEHVVTVKAPEMLKKLYTTLKTHQIAHLQDFVATCSHEGSERIMLHQLASGTLKFDPVNPEDPKRDVIISKFKAEWIKENLKGKRIAIFYYFTIEAQLIESMFDCTYSDVEFNEDPTKTFIGQTNSAGRGIDLSVADALVFFNLPTSFRDFDQCKTRLLKWNRTKPADVYIVMSDLGIEKKVYKALSKKTNFTNSFYKKTNYASKNSRPSGKIYGQTLRPSTASKRASYKQHSLW